MHEPPTNPFHKAMAGDRQSSFSIQNACRASSTGELGAWNNFEVSLDIEELANQRGRIFSIVEIPESTDEVSIEHIGYIAEKYEFLPTGERLRHPTIVMGNPWTTTGIDTRVRIGGTYVYSVRTICIFEQVVRDITEGKFYKVKYLFASKPSPSTTLFIDPTKFSAVPGAPGEVNFIWDYGGNLLNIAWAFPVEPERDIKYFQVYRRKKLWEPFQLIREYDFNDADVPWPRHDYIRPSLRTKLKSSKTAYIDPEFKKDSMFVYAIVAIDAHGQSSNYSQQFAVWFDIHTNQLMVRLVSASGAPLAYPNMYLEKYSSYTGENVAITEDVIRMSTPPTPWDPSKNRFAVVFDPYELKLMQGDVDLQNVVFNSKGPGAEPTEEGPQYLMQVTNLDLQQSKIIPIKIHDIRDL